MKRSLIIFSAFICCISAANAQSQNKAATPATQVTMGDSNTPAVVNNNVTLTSATLSTNVTLMSGDNTVIAKNVSTAPAGNNTQVAQPKTDIPNKKKNSSKAK